MDSLEINKIIAAVLVAGIAFMVAGFIGEILVHPRELAHPAIKIAGLPAAATQAQPAPAKAAPILPLLAAADPAAGKKIVDTQCIICHSFGQGEGPKIGPNLYGVVGGPRAHETGFDYTAGFKKLGGTWTYDNLNQWLWDPQLVAPGTRMAFPGLKNTKQRADVIAYLRSLSPTPAPLPSAEEVKAAEAAAEAAKPAPAAEQKPAAPPTAPRASFPELLAAADPAKGKTDAGTQCAICHSFGKGEAAKIGPNLYGIIGAARAHAAGFDYSAGLKKLGGTWTYDELNAWLTDPKAVVADTRMIFPGVRSEKERADIVAYLRTLADTPEPLPQPAAAPAAAAPQPAPAPAAAAAQPVAPTPAPQPEAVAPVPAPAPQPEAVVPAPAPQPEAAAPKPAPAEQPAAPAPPAAAAPQPAPAPPAAAAQPVAPTPAPPPEAAAPATPAAAPPSANFAGLLAAADPAEGKKISDTQCVLCHSLGKGEPAKIGPNLYGIIGAARAHETGFDYSAGLKKLGGTWTYDELNQWLADPRAVVPDTRMLFPGVQSEKERADVVAYLRTLADTPEPLPPAAAPGAPAAEPRKP